MRPGTRSLGFCSGTQLRPIAVRCCPQQPHDQYFSPTLPPWIIVIPMLLAVKLKLNQAH